LRLQKGRNNRTTRKNGKSNNKVDIVRGPKLPVDVACCRIVRERISPPPLCSYSPVAPRIFLVDVQVSAMSVVHHHYHRRCRRRRRRQEHGSQAGDPSTPSFSSNPRGSYSPASFPARHFPSPFAPFFPPVSSSLPAARCILNQSLGGNAITRHHDASTIFYFKLLYVLVPPPCTPSLATLLVGSVHPLPLVSALRQ